ncbi:N-acetylmuramoyl-L-alanine amidase [Amycolatopsis jejuensis]|uniref:N-acetylmuramoyl-L-alanine amidase n=1 Tax=Amycolatopsis jejuensis TaxID=330084 RepID=UPI0005241AE1|nr:N-acetylmuramoyl-L-alanine amidase [Amycolatopsis jejuensis]
MSRFVPWRLGAVTAGLLALAAVAVTVPAQAKPADEARQRAFADAASEFGVPLDVLLGVSYLESRWDSHPGSASKAGGYGPMHLTDLRSVGNDTTESEHDHGDARGDTSRPMLQVAPRKQGKPPKPSAPPPGSQTIDKAAELLGTDADTLRKDPAENIRGGAALLADYQRQLGIKSANVKDWYGAVARYSGSDDLNGARTFADEVFNTIRSGIAHRTDDGQSVKLAPKPDAAPDRAQADRLGLRADTTNATNAAECPQSLTCEWKPAPFQKLDDGTYVGYDKADRPKSQKIEYIVIHDTEGAWDGTLKDVQTPRPKLAAWNYMVRSRDGLVAQAVATKDIGWHAGNFYVNSKSVGVEHEGFAGKGTWYTEAMYRASAKLVGYLAKRFGIPLDREHILGHDTVPGPDKAHIPGMHWDPGPYWDWAHYFDLLGAPLQHYGTPGSKVVMIAPDFSINKPAFTSCEGDNDTKPCPERGSSAVVLRTEPNDTAPLLSDVGMHGKNPSTMRVDDMASRVTTGQKYVVAETKGDWTAIWYLGQKGWFRNPGDAPTAYPANGRIATPKAGKQNVPVYGRAYPEAEAYPKDIKPQELAPLPYQFSAGQQYAAGPIVDSEYYKASFDSATNKLVKGKTKYVQVQIGYRTAFVNQDDVDLS